MAVFGESWDDPKTALWLTLASGLLSGRGNLAQNAGAGLLGGMQAYQGARQDEMRRKLMQSQIAENEADARYRDSLRAKGIDPKLPMDIQSARLYMQMTPGERRAALEWKRGDYDLKEMNGVLQRISMSGLGSDVPLTTLSKEAGAQATIAGAKQRAQEIEKANYDLVNGFNQQTQRMEFRPRIDLLPTRLPSAGYPAVGAQPPQFPPGSPPNAQSDRVRILRDEIALARENPRAYPPSHVEALQRELENAIRVPVPQPGLPSPQPAPSPQPSPTAQFSPPEEGKRADARNEDEIKARTAENYISEARRLIPNATGSDVGTVVDRGLSVFGLEREAGKNAERLRVLGGWLTSNVPRMEGPQGVLDVQLYKEMAAQAGDSTKPPGRRLAALETLDALMKKQAAIKRGIKGGREANVPPETSLRVEAHEAIARGADRSAVAKRFKEQTGQDL